MCGGNFSHHVNNVESPVLINGWKVERHSPSIRVGLVVPRELPRKKSSRQRAPGKHGETLVLHQGEHLAFKFSPSDRVIGLCADELGQAVLTGDTERFHKLPGGQVRTSDVSHLTGTN